MLFSDIISEWPKIWGEVALMSRWVRQAGEAPPTFPLSQSWPLAEREKQQWWRKRNRVRAAVVCFNIQLYSHWTASMTCDSERINRIYFAELGALFTEKWMKNNLFIFFKRRWFLLASRCWFLLMWKPINTFSFRESSCFILFSFFCLSYFLFKLSFTLDCCLWSYNGINRFILTL